MRKTILSVFHELPLHSNLDSPSKNVTSICSPENNEAKIVEYCSYCKADPNSFVPRQAFLLHKKLNLHKFSNNKTKQEVMITRGPALLHISSGLHYSLA